MSRLHCLCATKSFLAAPALALLLAASLPARAADGVLYLDESGAAQHRDAVTEITDCPAALAGGWYVVEGDVTCDSGATVVISGDVNLILGNGSSLTVTQGADGDAGIRVASGDSLTVYAQSADSAVMGALAATGGEDGAGIGGGIGEGGGAITLHGGKVTAISGSYGAGIGGGSGGDGGRITITGGMITAANESSYSGAGIGGGAYGAGGAITITGGTVKAASYTGAGIGGGRGGGAGGTILISGGVVTAVSNYSGAGIGGGSYGEGGQITITGDAQVTASSVLAGAGIGSGGTNPTPVPAGTITIDTTGAVSATGGGEEFPWSAGANIGQGGSTLFAPGGGPGAGIDSFISPPSQSVAEGGSASFACVTAMADAPAPSFAATWEFSANTAPPSWSAVPGATGVILTRSPAAAGMAGLYRCAVTLTGLAGDPASSITYASGPVRLTVTPAAGAAAIPALEPAMLALLALLLGGAGARTRRGG